MAIEKVKEYFKYLIKLIVCFLLFYFIGDILKWT